MEPQETVEQPRKKQKQHHPTGHEQSVKRATVEWFFDRLGRPPREQWDSPELMPLDNNLNKVGDSVQHAGNLAHMY